MDSFTFSSNPYQSYVGSTLNGNLHGPGFYMYEGERKFFYDGLFYLNDLEGYGQVFYGDGSHFQGLYRENRRFGPGALTHADGSQDVGLWNGISIARLGSKVEDVELPLLQSTPVGKAKLLKYRNLVSVCDKPLASAEEILRSHGGTEETLRRCHELYNSDMRNRNSLFFDKRLYDEAFFCNQNCTIEVPDGDCAGAETEDTPEEQSTLRDLHARRIRQIESYLEKVDETLAAIRRSKEIAVHRLERCKECCVEGEERFVYNGVGTDELEEYISLDEFIEIMPTQEHLSILTLDLHAPCDSQLLNNFAADDKESFDEPPLPTYLARMSCLCVEGSDSSVNLAVLQQQMEELSKDENFYSTIRNFLNTKRERHVNANDQMTWGKNRKVEVQHLIAWNNEKLIMDMLKHSFLHRESEYMVTFTVADILTGKRGNFGSCGPHEQACKDFLVECYDGKLIEVIKYMTESNVDVNVTDSRGNTAVFFAMMGKRFDLLKILVDFGANLNQVNDESLTVLTMGLLQYLSLKYDLTNWEESFLPPDQPDDEEAYKWYSTSVHSQKRNSSFSGNEDRAIKGHRERQSIATSVLNGTPYFFEPVPKRDVSAELASLPEKRSAVNDLEDLLLELLELGVDPNLTEVPLSTFLIAVFTESPNLVKRFMDSGAKTDVKMPEGRLTCLHVIASLQCCEENVDICRILTRDRRCNANETADPDHLPKAAKWLMGAPSQPQDYVDAGMNPLHLLCLRDDFTNENSFYFVKLAKLLIKGGCDPSDTYLGHTPLSIAALRSNHKLVQELLMCQEVDIYQLLGDDMGNVLTVHGLKKYDDMLTIPQSKDTLDFLVAKGVNPLMSVGTCENAVEFLREVEKIQPNQPKRATKHSSNSVFVREYLTHLSRKVLVDFVKMEAVRYLYNVMEAGMALEDNFKILAQYLTLSQALRNLIALFESGKLPKGRFFKDLCIKVFQYVEANQIEDTKTRKKQTLDELDLTQLDDIDFFRYEVEKNLVPDLSRSGKNKVCFTCLLSRGKNLVVCTRCEHFYFCSHICYESSVREKTGHVCRIDKLNFDNQTRVTTIRGGLKDLCEFAVKCSESVRNKRIAKMLSEISRSEKCERAKDVYGTNAIKDKQMFSVRMKTSTLATLRSSMDRRLSTKSTRKEVPPAIREELRVLEQKVLATWPRRDEKPAKTSQDSRKTLPIQDGNDAVKSKRKDIKELSISNDINMKVTEKRYVRSVKSKKFPEKARYFVELLKKYFPEGDFSDILLPYACYADGHLYYNFRDGNYFCKSYSQI